MQLLQDNKNIWWEMMDAPLRTRKSFPFHTFIHTFSHEKLQLARNLVLLHAVDTQFFNLPFDISSTNCSKALYDKY